MTLPKPSDILGNNRDSFTLARRGPSVDFATLVERSDNLKQMVVARITGIRPGWLRLYGMPRNIKLTNLARFELWDDEYPDRPGQYLYARLSTSQPAWVLVQVVNKDGHLYARFDRGAFSARVDDLDGAWARTPEIPT